MAAKISRRQRMLKSAAVGQDKPGSGLLAKGAPSTAKGDMPTKDEILAFVRGACEKVGKREIARAFNIKGDNRASLKRLLTEMAHDGTLAGNRKALKEKGVVPAVAVLDVTGRDPGGDLVGEPAVWEGEEAARPCVLILTRSGRESEHVPAIGVGDRVLARVTKLEGEDVAGFRYEAKALKKLPREGRRLLGIFRAREGASADRAQHRSAGKNSSGGGTIEPIDRKELRSYTVQTGDEGSARDGDLVRFDLGNRGRATHGTNARVVETLGNPGDQRKISLIAIHAHGLPDEFPDAVLAEAEALVPATLGSRLDLRHLPFVTIDPSDARDHDDAVYAEAIAGEAKGAGPSGFVVWVAIADVAHYVRPGSALDTEALKRGNSIYFPDRVVPMLPERISNDLCSLREAEDRPCLALRLVFDMSGTKREHTLARAMIRSKAKLAYEEAQAAIDGRGAAKATALLDRVLKPLWAAYSALKEARERREPLDLDLPERRIVLDGDGRVARVVTPERLDAHRLIEEFMIAANVAAAEIIEAKKGLPVYRVHEPPSREKLRALAEFLGSLDLSLPAHDNLRPAAFNRILAQAKSLPVPELVNEVVLRSQAQADYRIENAGHFGLNLKRYSHFTSPIRRYADLLVHRAAITACGLGQGGADNVDRANLAGQARTISDAERRAMAAERETTDRLIAAHLADRVGATFAGRISGVIRAGLFVRLKETGADGFVPASSLGAEYFTYVEAEHALVAQRSGCAYRLGEAVEVRLVEAIPSAGALRFEMVSGGNSGTGSRLARTSPSAGVRRIRRQRGRV